MDVYEKSDLDSLRQQQTRISNLINELHQKHDELLDEGKEIGDPNGELDELESQLEAVLDEYLKFQIAIDEECHEKKVESDCGGGCVWLEEKGWRLQFWAKAKGFCTSKAKAQAIEFKYMESAEQLKEISSRLEKLSKKKILNANEKKTLKYLNHLKKEILEVVEGDTMLIKNLAASLALRDAYEKLYKMCKADEKCKLKEVYKDTITELDQRIVVLRQKESSVKRIKWGVVAVVAAALFAYYYWVYGEGIIVDAIKERMLAAAALFQGKTEHTKSQIDELVILNKIAPEEVKVRASAQTKEKLAEVNRQQMENYKNAQDAHDQAVRNATWANGIICGATAAVTGLTAFFSILGTVASPAVAAGTLGACMAAKGYIETPKQIKPPDFVSLGELNPLSNIDKATPPAQAPRVSHG
jgi:tetratricopeptide (TPR) repeat protein